MLAAGCASSANPGPVEPTASAPLPDGKTPTNDPQAAQLDGRTITLELMHAGGCGGHEYEIGKRLANDGAVELWLVHYDLDGDSCDAMLWKDVTIELPEDWMGREVRVLRTRGTPRVIRTAEGTDLPFADR